MRGLLSQERVLFVSAFYPPHEIGGWGQLVADINHRLQQRGATTHVLTSNFQASPAQVTDGVSRVLALESDVDHYRILRSFFGRKQRTATNQTKLNHILTRFQPTHIFIHNLWNLDRSIAATVEQRYPQKTTYYMASDWVYAADIHQAYWQRPTQRGLINAFKKVGAMAVNRWQTPLQFKRVLCVSKAIRRNLRVKGGISAENLHVVHNGIDLSKWSPALSHTTDSKLSLLYAGTLAPHKGVHTAIEAMASLSDVHLTVVGDGHDQYKTHLRTLAAQLGVGDCVTFAPRVARDYMPALLRRFDVLLLPSVWEEPLARIVQEAMASGVIVVGTATGGSAEIIYHNETGLVFDPENAADLTQQIDHLLNHPQARTRLVQNALALVRDKFDIDRMIDHIEYHLTA